MSRGSAGRGEGKGWRRRRPSRVEKVDSALTGLLVGAAAGFAAWYVARLVLARDPVFLRAPSRRGDDRPIPPDSGKGGGAG